ncbi:MAG: ABC transporter substrate-binding protein [Candidatus Heimdallarchaeota archaeon]
MRGIKKRVIALSLIILFFAVNFSVSLPVKSKSFGTFFTLKGLTSGGGVRPDYLGMMKVHLNQIGINLDIVNVDWSTFIGELIAFHNYDLVYLGLSGGGYDPDFTGIYNENGTLNLFGYHTSMDWDDCLGGINEWYMKQGTLIMPPDSEERIQHYWAWQQYLMDKICPMLPTFSPKAYNAYWANLVGYNMSDGILQSWGKISWDGSHEGQVSTDEFVITDAAWSDLNPLFQDDTSSSFISNAIMDPLIWYDADLTVYPHLAESYTHINDTHVRITIREGIKWAPDPDEIFTDEYLDVKDVYFTLYCWKYVSNDQHLWEWLEDIEIIDNYTLDLFIDGNSTTEANDAYAPYLSTISTRILPEHYLNQTQIADNVTPNITHSSWEKFSNNAFGTGLFEIVEYSEDNETILAMRPDCWRLNPLITNDPFLNWVNRFGDFSGGINQLRIRIIPDQQTSLLEFEAGKVDLEGVGWNPAKKDCFCKDSRFTVQSDTTYSFGFLGYNMRENRNHIGSREPCPGDSSISKGLAVRKAISYAINLVEINNIIHYGEYTISHTPLYPKMGKWNNPNIIRYDFDLDMAKYYMYLAGYDIDYTPTVAIYGFTGLITAVTIFAATIISTYRKKKTTDKN